MTSGSTGLAILLTVVIATAGIVAMVLRKRRQARMDRLDAQTARSELQEIQRNPDAMVSGRELKGRLESMLQ